MKLRGERWGNRPGVFGDDPGGGTAEVAVPASDIGGANKNLKNIENGECPKLNFGKRSHKNPPTGK